MGLTTTPASAIQASSERNVTLITMSAALLLAFMVSQENILLPFSSVGALHIPKTTRFISYKIIVLFITAYFYCCEKKNYYLI